MDIKGIVGNVLFSSSATLTYILAAVLWTALIGGIYSLWIASQILHATH